MSSRPSGEPRAMREIGGELQARSEQVMSWARSLPEISPDVFSGPAAAKIRGRQLEHKRRAQAAGDALKRAGQSLIDQAHQLEQRIRQWEDEQRRQRSW